MGPDTNGSKPVMDVQRPNSAGPAVAEPPTSPQPHPPVPPAPEPVDNEGLTPVRPDLAPAPVPPAPPEPPQPPRPSTTQPGPQKSGAPKAAIIAAVLIFLALAVVAVLAYLKSSQHQDHLTVPTPRQSSLSSDETTVAKSKDVDTALSQVDAALKKLNDNKDFAASGLTDSALGL